MRRGAHEQRPRWRERVAAGGAAVAMVRRQRPRLELTSGRGLETEPGT